LKSPERSRLLKEARRIQRINNISHIICDFEIDPPNDYFRLCSKYIKPADRHVFLCRAADEGIIIEKLNTDFAVHEYFRQQTPLEVPPEE
jgi:hypothetical protein